MDTQAKSAEKPTLLNLADKLMAAQSELDELTLQLALGKAEVKDKYEEIKIQFRQSLNRFRNLLQNRLSTAAFKEVLARLDQLEERLNTGTADTREKFVEERKFILKALRTLETEIKRVLPDNLDVQQVKQEMEDFRLKLEILHLRFLLKRFEIKDAWRSNADEVRRRVANIIDKARKKINR